MTFFRKNKALLLILTIWILSVFLFCFQDLKVKETVTIKGENTTGALVSGAAVEQTFVAEHNGLTSIDILLATYARINTSNVMFELFDEENNKIYSKVIPASQIIDNSYYSIIFEKIKDSEGKMYIVKLSSDADNGENAITIWGTEHDTYSDGTLYTCGEEKEFDIAFSIEYDDFSFFVDIFGAFFISSFIAVSCALFFLIYISIHKTRWLIKLFCWLTCSSGISVAISAFINRTFLGKLSLNELFAGDSIVRIIFFLCVSLSLTSVLFWDKEKILNLPIVIWMKSKLVSKEYFVENKTSARKTANTFAALAIVFGSLLIYLVPPSTTPDEPSHFQNICRMVSKDFFVDKNEIGLYGSELYPEELDFMSQTYADFSGDAGLAKRPYTFSDISNFSVQYGYGSNRSAFVSWSQCAINPLSYLSSFVGTFAAKTLFGISNPYDLLIYARFSNLIFSVIVIRLAILKTPIMRNTMFLLALMPMTFYQLVSVSYDVEAICGSFLLFAYVMKLALADNNYRITIRDILAVLFSCACLFAAKLIYIILALILFAINVKKFGSKKRYVFSIASVLVVGAVFYLVPTLITNYNIYGSLAGNSHTEVLPLISEQKNYIISHPNIVPSVLIETFKVYGQTFANNFIGEFGWLNVQMPHPFQIIYLLAFVCTAIVEICLIKNFRPVLRTMTILSVLITVLGIVFSMYISYTPLLLGKINNGFAIGVQGRYFIPAALFGMVCLANPLLCRFRHADKVYTCVEYTTKYTATAFLILSCAIILTAYWL